MVRRRRSDSRKARSRRRRGRLSNGRTARVDPGHDIATIILTEWMWESGNPPAIHRELLGASRAALA